LSRENSFVRQASMLSEISQPVNVNNIADLLEKFGNNIQNGNHNDSFCFNRRISRNLSFESNGCFSKNNSFRMSSFVNQPGTSINKQANDKYFEGIDEDVNDNNKVNYSENKSAEFGIREYQAKSSFKGLGSFKLEEPNSFYFKKPSIQTSPALPSKK
jgi:hypothetical protein